MDLESQQWTVPDRHAVGTLPYRHKHSMPQDDSATLAEWLTSEQVMDRLLEDASLRPVAATCVLPAVRHGDGWRFRKNDLEQWIARQRRGDA
jgi:hypothetical protein